MDILEHKSISLIVVLVVLGRVARLLLGSYLK